MRIEIYELRRGKDGFEIDKKRRVAVVTVKDGTGSFQFPVKHREKVLRALFENPVTSFVAGGKMLDGAHWDAAITYPAWSKEAIDLIVGEKLRGYNLGAQVIDDASPERNKR